MYITLNYRKPSHFIHCPLHQIKFFPFRFKKINMALASLLSSWSIGLPSRESLVRCSVGACTIKKINMTLFWLCGCQLLSRFPWLIRLIWLLTIHRHTFFYVSSNVILFFPPTYLSSSDPTSWSSFLCLSSHFHPDIYFHPSIGQQQNSHPYINGQFNPHNTWPLSQI